MLRPSLIPKRNFEAVPFNKTSIDLYDLGKCDSNGKRYLVSICDHLTGYLDGVPIHNKTDRLVSQALNELILRYGFTGKLISDNGAEFGPLCKEIFKKFNLIHVTTSAYFSASNGKVERQHRQITEKLRLLNTKRREWSQKWPFVRFLINNLPRTSLDGLSAAECLFGRALFCPFETVEKLDTKEKTPFVRAVNDYLNDLHPSLMQFQYQKYSQLLKKDKGGAPIIKIGQKCLLWKPTIVEGKLSRCWSGPYRVIKRISKDSYILKNNETKMTYRRNIRHLRPIPSSETEKPESNSEAEISLQREIDSPEHGEFQNRFYFANMPFDDQ